MNREFLDRISQLSPKRLALLAAQLNEQLQAATRPRDPIAVVGAGCRLPGGSADPTSYWELLRDGKDAVREVPPDRWDLDALYDADPDMPGRMSTRYGGFLDRVGEFEPEFFGITPREAITMDPQQRLLLEVSWEALEDAGVAPSSLGGSATGVFVGICNSDYFQRAIARGREAIDAYLASGNAMSVAAGRLAYVLGLNGPALSIDTSCSSSLVALHLASESLRRRESQVALACGVNLILSPETMIALSKARMLAPDGRCKAFDASGDGFGRGEGCVVLVLKRLPDALEANDRILGIIRGTAINQDGRSGGLTVPSGPAQEAVIRAALADAGVSPAAIDYVEAHGTGTSLGDPIEVRALAAALGAGRSPDAPLVIGSVKTNFGHLESAAGLAGVLKVLLALRHERIPRSLHFRTPSPHIGWSEIPVTVAGEARPWPRGARPRLAGVSSFGFSGTNAHAIVEEAPGESAARVPDSAALRCLPLSARDGPALTALVARTAAVLADRPELSLEDAAYTAGVGRAHFGERLAVVASSNAQAREALAAAARGEPHPRVHTGTAVAGATPEIAFLFTGQGSQYPGMAQGLYEAAPVFRDVIDRCDALLGPDPGGRTLKSVLAPGPSEGAPIHETAWTQPALFAVEYGLCALWRSWGVEPSAVIGHSAGEYVAACVAGVFSFEDGLRLIAERGRLLQALPAGGAMAAVFAPVEEVAPAVAPYADRVAVAAINAADSAVISGEARAVESILGALERRDIKGHRLFVSFAAHSPLVQPAMAALEASAARVTMHEPRIPVAWNVTGGAPLPGKAPDPRYWSRHLRETVRFADGLASLRGYDVFLEIGPHPVLMALAERSLPESSAHKLLLGSLRRGKDDLDEMLASLAKLYSRGAKIDFAGVASPGTPRRVSWPSYPFQRRTFWIERSEPHSRTSPEGREVEAPGPGGSPEGLCYRVSWEPAPVAAPAARSLRPVAEFVPAIRERFRALATDCGLSVYESLLPELDRSSAQYAGSALRALGFDETLARVFDPTVEARQLGIATRHDRLFARILEMMAEDGVLRARGASFEVTAPLPTLEPGRHEALLTRFGATSGELSVLHRTASQLARVLKGDQDPLALLFPGGEFAEARKLYVESPFARTYNATIAAAIAAAIAKVEAPARLRILEIGAGTGGTTGYVLPHLPPASTGYTFTDVSPVFLERAAERFAAYPFVERALLNVERAPWTQGLQRGAYDVVIAANVLHATSDLRRSVEHARDLLAPGGLLVLLEGVTRERWADLTFGMTEGWWCFTDTALRPSYPLLDRRAWIDLLGATGFTSASVVPDETWQARGGAQQAIILAQAPARTARFTILGDPGGVGAALARCLERDGGSARVLRTDAPESDLGSADEVVYLGALDLADDPAEGSASRVSSARRSEALACELPLEWLARLARRDDAGRAWLVTRGGQRVQGEAAPGAAWQAPLWGVGRVFALEQPARWGGLVDLPTRGTADELAELLREAIDRRVRVEDDEDQVAWRGGSRLAARLVSVAPPRTALVQLRAEATYLITGAFGAVGPILARWLVERGARHVALLGRHASPDHEAVRVVESMGARALPFAVDIADEAGLRAVLAHFGQPGTPPVRGIVHAAADVSSAPIDQLTREQIRRMLRPKIQGTVVLEQLTGDQPLDFVVLFSTTTALLGAWGLAHYAAANAFLDGFAQAAPGARRVVSVNWGSWETMHASAERQRAIHEGGLGQMSTAETLDALGRLLTGSDPQTMVARVDWGILKALYEARRPRRFLARVGAAQPAARPKERSAVEAPGSRLVEQLARAPATARRELIVDAVVAEVSAVLGVDVGRAVPLDTGLFDLGMDSLMSVELRKRLERVARRALPSTLTFNYPSVNAMATFLESVLVAVAPVPTSDRDSDEPAAESGLTDAEVEARLRERLERYG